MMVQILHLTSGTQSRSVALATARNGLSQATPLPSSLSSKEAECRRGSLRRAGTRTRTSRRSEQRGIGSRSLIWALIRYLVSPPACGWTWAELPAPRGPRDGNPIAPEPLLFFFRFSPYSSSSWRIRRSFLSARFVSFMRWNPWATSRRSRAISAQIGGRLEPCGSAKGWKL